MKILEEDCKSCTEKGLDKNRGCLPGWPNNSGNKVIIFKNTIIDTFEMCPKAYFIEGDRELMLLESVALFKKANILPFAGGYYDQPNIFCEALEILLPEFNKMEDIMRKNNGTK
ncbi:MAG: hypothetical protein HC877_20720 [Thioploca sp.]|nr:hypothetical protein [Thioploca sp.]